MREAGSGIGALLLLLPFLAAMPCCAKVPPEGAGPSRPDLSGRKLRVVATTGMVADLVRNVAGDRAEVDGLMGPGIDPHLYKPSEGAVTRMAAADVVFYNGLHLEGKLAEVFAKMGGRVRTVAVAEGIDPSRLLSPQEFEGAHDPHVWFDVSLWQETVSRVAEALVELDPAGADRYRGNADRYRDRLRELDRYVRRRAAEIPPGRRVLVTAHDAFHYFGRAYGFEVRGLQGVSTAAEVGARDIRELADFLAARRLPAVFVETSVPPRYIEALQEAVRARGHDLAIGGGLYSDAPGDPDGPAGTYEGMVRTNIDTIAGALAR